MIDYPINSLNLDEIKSLVTDAKDLGLKSIKLTGGEPFLMDDIISLLKWLKSENIFINIETNGTLIGDKEAEVLKATNASVSVSIDAPVASVHDYFRGVDGAFDKAVNGIDALRRCGVKFQLIACLYRGNIDIMENMIQFAKDMGASSLKINPVNKVGRAQKMQEEGELLSVVETIKFYNHFQEKIKADNSIKVFFDIPPAFKPIRVVQKEGSTCAIHHILGILGDGTISICGIGSTVHELSMGSIYKNDIREVWNHHPILELIRDGVPHKLEGICGKCILKNYCLGKCRADSYYHYGSLTKPLQFCQEAYELGIFPKARLVQ